MTTYTVRREKARNPWCWKPYPNRDKVIAGVMIHATRSGQPGLDYDDGPGTENWGANPNNGSASQGWGTYWDLLIYRNGTRVVSTDWDWEFASWTAGYGGPGTWAAGHYYLMIEVSQSRNDQPYSAESIDSLAQAVAEAAARYNFPIERIPFLRQTGERPRGICTHEASANGEKSGKTDPGKLFPWKTFLGLANDYLKGGDEVTREEYEALRRDVDDMRRIFTGGAPAGEAEYTRWLDGGNSLLLGYAGEQAKLGAHLASPHGGAVPEHTHATGPAIVGGGE